MRVLSRTEMSHVAGGTAPTPGQIVDAAIDALMSDPWIATNMSVIPCVDLGQGISICPRVEITAQNQPSEQTMNLLNCALGASGINWTDPGFNAMSAPLACIQSMLNSWDQMMDDYDADWEYEYWEQEDYGYYSDT